MVVDGTQVKVLAWYDNEWGYVNRMIELARKVGRRRQAARPARSDGMSPPDAVGDLRNYMLVTGAYWAVTLTDGALRMLVLFYFNELGYTPSSSRCSSCSTSSSASSRTSSAAGSRRGSASKATLVGGLAIQVVALAMLAFAPSALARRCPT